MEEFLHHLGCIKPCRWWDKLPFNWCRISSINSIVAFNVFLTPSIAAQPRSMWSAFASSPETLEHTVELHFASASILPKFPDGGVTLIHQETEDDRSYRNVCSHNYRFAYRWLSHLNQFYLDDCRYFKTDSCTKLSNSWPSFTELIHIQDGQARHILCHQVAHVHPRRPNAHFSNPNVAVDLIWKLVKQGSQTA